MTTPKSEEIDTGRVELGETYAKTATIRAKQWWHDGDHPGVYLREALGDLARDHIHPVPWCPTLEGGHIVTPGDWIATGVNGEHWPIKPDVFAKTYRLAQASAAEEVRKSGFRCHNCKLVTQTTDTHAPDRCPECRCRDFSAVASAASAGVRDAGREAICATLGEHFPLAPVSQIILAADAIAALTARPDGGEADVLPADVRRLVIAARVVTDAGVDDDEGRELFDAVEAFSARVPYEDEPDATTATGGADREAEIARLREAELAAAAKRVCIALYGRERPKHETPIWDQCTAIACAALGTSAAKEAGK